MKQPDLTVTPLTPPGSLPLLSRSPWSTPTDQSRSPFLAAQSAQSDMLLGPPRSSRSSRRYSRRQLSYDDVRCVHVDEGSSTGGEDMYTFRVRPNVLKLGSWRGSKTSRRSKSDNAEDDEDGAQAVAEGSEEEEQEKLPSYRIQRSATEVLDMTSRLLTSFDTLLDEKRGGPYPLSKELLQSKKNLKDFFRRKRKKVNAHEDSEESLTGLYKIALVNEFFTKAIQTGGEVVSSSRAMQDFFDQSASFKKGDNDVLETVPTLRLPKNKPILADLLIGEHSPASEASNRFNTPASWRSISPFTPNSANLGDRSQSRYQLWKKPQIEIQGKGSASVRGLISNPITLTPAMSTERQRHNLKISTEDVIRQPRTPKDIENVRVHSVGSQDEYDDWREDVSKVDHNRRTSIGSSTSLISPQSSASDVFPYGQLKQVSGVAIKTKAIGWKFTKGTYPPNALLSNKTSTPSSDGSPLRSLLTHHFGSQVSLPCSTLSAPAGGVDASPYKPSALEKLIFGNEGRHLVTTSATSSEEEDYFGPDAIADSSDCKSRERSASPSSTSLRVSEDNLASPCSGSCDRGERSAYRSKGKACDLFLDLKGRSNLHTESMPNADTIKQGATISAFSFDEEEEEEEVGEEGEMQEIELNRGPISARSPVLTPISQQLAAIQKEAENMALFHRQELYQMESSKSTSHAHVESHSLGGDADCFKDELKQKSAIETDVQVWQARQGRKLLSPN